MKTACSVLLAIVVASGATCASAAATCDDKCLYGIMNEYLEHLTRHDPGSLPVASELKTVENGEPTKLGSGSWTQVTKVYPGQNFADATTGQVVHIGAVQIANRVGALFLRLKVVNRRITESELVSRGGEPGFKTDVSGLLEPDILYDAIVPPARRSSRAQLTDIVDHYATALSKHDGSLASFSYRCDRYSAGSKFTNTGKPADKGGSVTCETSLAGLTGQDVANLRLAVIDPERGVVVALFIIPHGERKPPSGTNVAEVFKIVDGKIRSIEEFGFPGKFPPSSGFPDT